MRLRVATFNVHHCQARDGAVDVERTAEAIRATGAQLVALQELDRGLSRSGHTDQPAELARLLEMEMSFWPTLTRQGGEYGIALAAIPAVSDPRYVPLPRLDGEEPRGAIVAAFLGLTVVATHLSTHAGSRRSQVRVLAELARQAPGPTVVMGDLNLGPRSLRLLVDRGFRGAFGHITFPDGIKARQIDHILVSDGARILRSWTVPTEASDHLPLVTDVELADLDRIC